MSVQKAALALWAKSGDPFHPLLAHMLDTAAVAKEVLYREPPRSLALYAEDWRLSEEKAARWVAFLVGLHDLGKASPVFQAGWPEGARRVREAGFSLEEGLDWVAHGVFTELFLRQLLKEKGLPKRATNDLAAALGAHHGFPASGEEKKKARNQIKRETPLWWEARRWLLEELFQRLLAPLPRLEESGEARPEAVLRVMALASFADWVASDPGFFPYGRDPMAPDYLEEAQELAKRALDQVGWRPFRLPEGRDFKELFPFPPNPLQARLPQVLGSPKEPVLVLVEAPMGMGKTEAALFAHHLLEQSLLHRGLYVGLPTQATANGLFPRVQAFLERVLEKPEVQLQHGTALLNPRYTELMEKAHPTQVGEEAEGGAVASAWFSARKRAMLAPHGVGTLDQALLGVLRVRHHFVRLWGLMNRVVVLDEVHAYDVYTSGLLASLLRWLKVLGSSAIVMTATLPPSRRWELLAAWAGGKIKEDLDLGPYPRVVVVEGDGVRCTSLPPHRQVEVALKRVPVAVRDLAEVLKEALPGALGAIVNTVDRAQALYQALGPGEALTLAALVRRLEGVSGGKAWEEVRGALPERGGEVVGKVLGDGTLVFLLHARFPAEERALREGVIVALFGKEGPRPERAILVATQVAEQSLDLDFDLLYTDLAPIDLLFQRAGRLHRHERPRPEKHAFPRLLLGVPEGLDFGKPLYWDAVYEDFVLLSTWWALEGKASLRIPQDLEPLLEAVYEDEDPGKFPELLLERARKSLENLKKRRTKEAETARAFSLSDPARLLAYWDEGELVARERLEDDEEKQETQRLLTRLGDLTVAVVPLYRVGEGLFLDREGRRRAPLKGELSREEAEALFRRAVRLSRYPIPQTLLGQDPPSAWKKSGLLRGLRPLEMEKVFALEKSAFQVDLDPELGVVYREV